MQITYTYRKTGVLVETDCGRTFDLHPSSRKGRVEMAAALGVPLGQITSAISESQKSGTYVQTFEPPVIPEGGLLLTRLNKTSFRVTSLQGATAQVTGGSKVDTAIAAEALGVPAPEVTAALLAAKTKAPEVGDSYVHTPALQATPPLSFRVRGLREPVETAVHFPTLQEALASNPTVAEPLVEWGGTEAVAALDVDYHGQETPRRNFTLACVVPSPLAYWSTRSGVGARLIYQAGGGFTADELAASAALYILGRDPKATFEIKSDSRFPPAGGTIRWQTQTNDPEALRQTVEGREVSEDARDQFLEDQGWTLGQQLPHTSCPFNPQEATTHATCVHVMPDGLHCYKCKRTQPYSEFLGSEEQSASSSMLRSLVSNFTHWTHAKVVFENTLALDDRIARLLYSAQLKIRHGADDPRIPRVFSAGKFLVRAAGGLWMTTDLKTVMNSIPQTISGLPAVLTRKMVPDDERAELFQTTTDLSTLGYPPITPVRGIAIYGHFNRLVGGEIHKVVQISNLTPSQVPRYHRTVEADREWAWQTLESEFPGVNRNLIRLLIAAKGISEGEVGLSAFLYLHGVSQGGKTSHVNIAAALCGDSNEEVVWTADETRLRQSIKEGGKNGTFVTINEVLKGGGGGIRKLTPRERFDPFLTLTSTSTSHEMYVGPVPMGKVPVLVVTDISLPEVLISDLQIARRFVTARLTSKVNWEPTFARLKRKLRSDSDLAKAGNIIVSEVIDTYFAEAPKPLVEIAQDLGFPRMDRAKPFYDPLESLRHLFELVCKAPEMPTKYRKIFTDRGMVLISKHDETELHDTWAELCDEGDSGWVSSRRVEEQDWKKVLGTTENVVHDIKWNRAHSNVVAIRFRNEDGSKVNGELL